MLRQGDEEAALQLAADGVRMFPTYIGGYVILADCYAALGDVDDARVILTEAKRRFPSRKVIQQREAALDRQPGTPVTEPPKHTLVVRRRPKRESRDVPVGTLERKESPLRVIELALPSTDERIIRSSSVRLIPGLEYTSLRFEGSKVRGDRSITVIPEPPPFRTFHDPYGKELVSKTRTQEQGTVTLERLADRIGRVRMTSESLDAKPPAPDPLSEQPRQTLVTETLARIYMQQKSFDRAIESFRILTERYPDRTDEFQKLIEECISQRDAS